MAARKQKPTKPTKPTKQPKSAGARLLVVEARFYNDIADALLAGVPILTCRGEGFAGRVAASLLEAAGLRELVTDSLEDYEALALKLAREPDALNDAKRILAQNRPGLFDLTSQVRALEVAYRHMRETTSSNGFRVTADGEIEMLQPV